MGTLTFYDVVQPVLFAGSWTNKGSTPTIKRMGEDNFSAIGNWGILIEDLPKDTFLTISGSVAYENLNGRLHVRDTLQTELDKLEDDIKVIMRGSLSFQILSTDYLPTANNKYELVMDIKILN